MFATVVLAANIGEKEQADPASHMTWILTLLSLKFRNWWTRFLQATQAAKTKFKVGKNPVHKTREFEKSIAHR